MRARQRQLPSVTTYHNDNARTGQNLRETTLTTANVNATGFGMLFVIAADCKVDAQPLYLPGLSIAGAAHNVLFVATEHGSVYGFDADTGSQLWQVSTLAAGETPSDDHGYDQVTPEIGVTCTFANKEGPPIPKGTIAVGQNRDCSSTWRAAFAY